MGIRPGRRHKRFVAATALPAAPIVLLLAYGAATAGAIALTAEPGTPLVIELEGNPSTGYAWDYRLAGASARLVRVEECGWHERADADEKRMGRSKIFRCRIIPLEAGEAEITFVYRRSWETDKPPRRRRSYRIRIE